jgi:hypothetical protein
MIAVTLSRNPNRNHKLWNIGLTERYILHMQVLLFWTKQIYTTHPYEEK